MWSAERLGAALTAGTQSWALARGGAGVSQVGGFEEAAMACSGLSQDALAMFLWCYAGPPEDQTLVEAWDGAVRRPVWVWLMLRATDLAVPGGWRGGPGRLQGLVRVAMADLRDEFRSANGGGQSARAEVAGIPRWDWSRCWQRRYDSLFAEGLRLRQEALWGVEQRRG